MRRWSMIGLVVLPMLGAACGSPNPPTAPSSPAIATVQTAAADASADPVLKATPPTIVQPKDRVRVSSVTPTLEWQNSKGTFVDVAFRYQIELYEENVFLTAYTTQPNGGDVTTFSIPDALKNNTLYRWRVRAQYGNAFSAFAQTADFFTPASQAGGGQPYGPTRTIPAGEALAIIKNYHDRTGANLGSASTRDSRVAFFFSAVAIVHFGHSTYNPAGGDRDWCVKDAGGGRPPSDDVIVSCSTRDAWDLIGGAGADGYRFHLDYIGRLSSEQNVYPPPQSSLPTIR